MPRKSETEKISTIPCGERLEYARKVANENIDTALNLIGVYYARREAFGQNSFASKLPRSRAVGTFNIIMQRLAHAQCIETCRFWDKAEENGKSIPTIMEYCRNTDIEARLFLIAESCYPDDNDQTRTYHESLVQRFHTAERLIHKSNTDERLRRTQNFRNRIAHNLLSTRTDSRLLAKGEKPLVPPSAATLTALGIRTLWVSWLFHSSLNNADFDFKHSVNLLRRRSSDFWGSLSHSIDPRTM